MMIFINLTLWTGDDIDVNVNKILYMVKDSTAHPGKTFTRINFGIKNYILVEENPATIKRIISELI